jgi:hypothetical protein
MSGVNNFGSSSGPLEGRVLSVVDVDTGEELMPSAPPRQAPAGRNDGQGRAHSEWDAKVLIASWAALYPEMTDLIREWVEDAWNKGFTIQLTESIVRRKAEIEEPRILSERARRERQIDDPVERRKIEPTNAFEAQLIALKDEADRLRVGTSEECQPSPAPLCPTREKRAHRGAMVIPARVAERRQVTPGPIEPGLLNLPPHLQPAMDAAEEEYKVGTAQRRCAEGEKALAKEVARHEDEKLDALEAATKLAKEARLKKKAGSSSGSAKGCGGS